MSPVGPQGPVGKKNLGVWLKAHRVEAGIGAAVVAGAAVLYERSHKSSAAATAGQPCTDINGNASVTDSTGACIVNTSAAAAAAAAAAPATAAASGTGVPDGAPAAYSGTGGYGGNPDDLINTDDSIATMQGQISGLSTTDTKQTGENTTLTAEEAALKKIDTNQTGENAALQREIAALQAANKKPVPKKPVPKKKA